MYQDSGGVEDGEYHIMYGSYDSLKLAPDPTSPTIKLAAVVQDEGNMAAAGSLGTVTLSAGEALVSSALADSSLTVSSAALTPTSLNEHLVSSQVRGNTNPGSSIMTISAVAEASLGDADLGDESLAVTTLAPEQSRNEVDMNQIVSTSGQAVLDGGQLVTSSSIDAVVTSVFASDCVGMSVGGAGRKLPPQQVFVKLLGDDSHVLDMVQIIAEEDVDNRSNGFNILRNGTIVQKLAEGGIISDVSENFQPEVEVLRPDEGGKMENEAARQCSLTWACGYCNLEFPDSEACSYHQEKDCTENPNLRTNTSQATVDALMSPLRPTEEATYELKLDGPVGGQINITTEQSTAQEEECEEGELLSVWTCAVCGLEFVESKALKDHFLHHTIHELSAALMELTVPHQIIKKKKRRKVRSTNTETTAEFPTESLQTLTAKWSQECPKVKFTKIEESLVVENPGDTPPSTPPQEKLGSYKKRKAGPKARTKDKIERRRYVKKIGDDGQPICQKEQSAVPAGQGSRDPHTCQICNKVLSSRGNLSKHMILHKTKKPFVCTICGMGFNAKRDKVHHHLQHHTTERPNKCTTCGKGFVDINYLHEHMVFHKKERPFACDICGKFFLTARCVKRHKKRHREDRSYTCNLCLRSFAIKADLASHHRKVHRKKPQSGRQQQVSVSIQHITNQHEQQQQQQPHQQAKTEDIPEYIIPHKSPSHIISEEQLLAGELESAHKDTDHHHHHHHHTGNIFLTESLSVPVPIIPITAAEGGSCPYGIALATPPTTQGTGTGDTPATYIMIEGTDRGDVATSHNLQSTPGLIMYTPLPPQSQQVGSELEGSQEQRAPTLHSSSHHNSHTQDAGSLVEGQGSGLALDATPSTANNQSVEIPGAEVPVHDPTQHNSSHHDTASQDPTQTFPLELISQTIQLELQRSQASSTQYLA